MHTNVKREIPAEGLLAVSGGEDHFIWASDFPHIDAEYGVVAELKENIASLPESAQR